MPARQALYQLSCFTIPGHRMEDKSSLLEAIFRFFWGKGGGSAQVQGYLPGLQAWADLFVEELFSLPLQFQLFFLAYL